MRIDEIIYEAQLKIERHHGIKAITKITVTHEAFDKMIFSMASDMKYRYANISPSMMNDLEICGIRIEARERERK